MLSRCRVFSLSCCHAVVLSHCVVVRLWCYHVFVLSRSFVVVLWCFHAIVLSRSCVVMLWCCHAVMFSSFRFLTLSWCRAIVLARCRAFTNSYFNAVVLSRGRVFTLSCCHALVLSRRGAGERRLVRRRKRYRGHRRRRLGVGLSEAHGRLLGEIPTAARERCTTRKKAGAARLRAASVTMLGPSLLQGKIIIRTKYASQ